MIDDSKFNEEDIKDLDRKARETCEFETTSQTEGE